MRLWRVSGHRVLDGQGASEQGGRWNRPGTAVVYAAATLALATLEFLVHLTRARMRTHAVAHLIEVPEDVEARTIALGDLPDGWDLHPAPPALQDIGTSWVAARSTLLLSVPTAVLRIDRALIPSERAYLINPAHSAFSRVTARAETFWLDPRMRRR